LSPREQACRSHKARAAMDLLEAALATRGDPAHTIAGAPQPRAIRWLALALLAVNDRSALVLEPGAQARPEPPPAERRLFPLP
jgi:hypothetical protein